MADDKPGSGLPKHLPYEEEARMLSEVVDFFIHRLPHAIEDTAEHLDEAALSSALFGRLSQMTDDDLAEMGLHRDDIPSVAANMAGLFNIAHKAHSARS